MSAPIEELRIRLIQAMSKENIRAIELSEKTQIPKSSISQYMSGYAKPNSDRVYLLSKALNVSEAWLMGYDVPMERSVYWEEEQTKNDIQADIIIRMRRDKVFMDAVEKLYLLDGEKLKAIAQIL